MGPPGEPVISTWKRPCQKIQNGSEFPELVAQNFRNPQLPCRANSHTRKPVLRLTKHGAFAFPSFIPAKFRPHASYLCKGVGDGDASKLLSILKVFAVQNYTLPFYRRSYDQRIVPRQLEPGANPQRLSIQSLR
jgi:hypothetical protein